jgi:hypothetical protein
MTFAIRRVGRDGAGEQIFRDLPLKFNGSVGLKDLALHNFETVIPKEMIPNRVFGTNIENFRQILPPQIRVPITGTLNRIQIDPAKAVLANINPLQGGNRGGEQDPLRDLGNILNQLGNQNRDRQEEPRDPPPPPPRPRGRGSSGP